MAHKGKKELIIDKLIELTGQTVIAHHIPGRIRLKVNISGLLLARDLDAADLMKCFSGILDAKANAASRSIVISYDTDVVAPDFWEHLVNCKENPALKNSIREELQRLSRPKIAQCSH